MYPELQNVIKVEIEVYGRVTQADIIGAVFGQTEEVLGDQLDLRTLQKANKIGRIEVEAQFTGEKTVGVITIPSYTDRIQAVIIAAALETINKIGPCRASARVVKIVNIKEIKIKEIVEHAKKVLEKFMSVSVDSQELVDEVNASVRMSQHETYGEEGVPCGPSLDYFDDVIFVEGLDELQNMLKHGIKNVVAFEDCSKEKTLREIADKFDSTVFVDRGKDFLLKKLLDFADIDDYATAPPGKQVRNLQSKEIFQALRDAVSCEQFLKKSQNIPKIRDEGFSKNFGSDNRRDNRQRDHRSENRDNRSRDDRSDSRRDSRNDNRNRDDRRDRNDRKDSRNPRDRSDRNDNRNFQRRDDRRDPRRDDSRGPRVPEREASLFKQKLGELEGSNEAYVLDDKLSILGKLPMDALEDTIKGLKVYAIVTAGSISRNLISSAERARVKYLVGKSAEGRSRFVNVLTGL